MYIRLRYIIPLLTLLAVFLGGQPSFGAWSSTGTSGTTSFTDPGGDLDFDLNYEVFVGDGSTDTGYLYAYEVDHVGDVADENLFNISIPSVSDLQGPFTSIDSTEDEAITNQSNAYNVGEDGSASLEESNKQLFISFNLAPGEDIKNVYALSDYAPTLATATAIGGTGDNAITLSGNAPVPTAPVPEPATMLLLGSGLLGLIGFRKRLRK